MRVAFIVALVTAAALAIVAAAQAGPARFDVGAVLGRVEQERVRDHIAEIAVPRNSFAEPEQKQRTADYIQDELESYGYPVELFPVAFADATFPNVVGVHEGAMCPERVFVVGAHYDTVPGSPGADDDASGVAGMLEIARALAGTPLPATVWFSGFALEENGLVGSFNMAQDAQAAGTEIVGMASLEMIGYTSEGNDFIAVLGNTASVRLTDAWRRAGEAYVPELPLAILNLLGNGEEQPDSRRSDHAPFWDAGYQAVMVTDTANFRNPHYHQTSDTLETLDLAFATNVTRLTLATMVDYLTYDGDADGEADACSGPLIATPTATATATQSLPELPSATRTAMESTPTPADVEGLPDTGGGTGQGGEAPVAVLLLAGGVALVLAAAAVRRALVQQRL